MSDEKNTQAEQDELKELKERARLMDIQFHPTISLEKLRERVNSAVEKKAPTEKAAPAEEEAKAAPRKETEHEFRLRKKQEAEALVRVRITCMNPNKREWDGEIITAGNAVVGTHRKYVPFDTEWHVPRIIYNVLRDRQCQVFVTERDSKGRQIRRGKQIKEFSIEVLPQLSEKELKELAQRQAMARGEVN